MKQPQTHAKPQHGSWADRWNPYRKREQIGYKLDKSTLNAIIGRTERDYQDPDLFCCGCLDAPEDIPLGATASIRTVGGFYCEEYLKLGREWESWERYNQALAGTAAMIAQLLADIDKEENNHV